jgi:hypothetical protein
MKQVKRWIALALLTGWLLGIATGLAGVTLAGRE